MLTAARGFSGRQAPKRATCVTAFILVAVVSLLGEPRRTSALHPSHPSASSSRRASLPESPTPISRTSSHDCCNAASPSGSSS